MKKIINIKELVKDKFTYPSWSTASRYRLRIRNLGDNVLVYYKTRQNREISRVFPKEIPMTYDFIYSLGLLKGEGSNSLGKSNYRRFTITNSDYKVINYVLRQLEIAKLFSSSNLNSKAIHILHHRAQNYNAVSYWSEKLNLPKKLFKCFDAKRKTTKYGVCHVYISDVLLRRVVDLIQEKFF